MNKQDIYYIGKQIPKEWKDKIQIYLDIACKELKLNKPELIFKTGNHCFYYYLVNTICIGNQYLSNNMIFDIIQPYINLKLNKDKLRLFIFTVFHELGHCYHNQKLIKLTLKYEYEYDIHNNSVNIEYKIMKRIKLPSIFDKKYRNLKLEKIADKISITLCKRYFPELFLE